MTKMKNDPRIDPRIKALLGNLPAVVFTDVDNRQQALDEANTPAAVAQRRVPHCPPFELTPQRAGW